MRGAEEIGDPNDILHPYFVPSQYGQAGEEKWRCEGAAPRLTRYRRFGFPQSVIETCRRLLTTERLRTSASLSCSAAWNPAPASASACAS